MSDSEHGKRLHEIEDLSAFLIAYERETGAPLRSVDSGESPDFICARPNGRRIGVELTKVYVSCYIERRIGLGSYYRYVLGLDPITGYDIADKVSARAYLKTEKVRSGVLTLKTNILVLQTYDLPLSEIAAALDDLAADIATSSAFREIWVADFCDASPFREIDLYCIRPTHFRGYHPGPWQKRIT